MLDRLFLAHPRSVGETYWQHLRQALSFALHLVLAAAACMIHAVLPFMFRSTGSAKIAYLHDRMVRNRRRPAQSEPQHRAGRQAYVPDYVI